MSITTKVPADCGSKKLHGSHYFWGGFAWYKKKFCRGSFPDCKVELADDFEPPNAALRPSKTVNQIRADMGYPEYQSEEEEDQPSVELPLTIIDHKHDFKLADGFDFGPDRFIHKHESDLLWKCDWTDCNHLFVISRDLWYERGAPYDAY